MAAIVPEQAPGQGREVGGESRAENRRPKDEVAEPDRLGVGVRRLRGILFGTPGCQGPAGICGPCSPLLRHRPTIPKTGDLVERPSGLASQVFGTIARHDPLFDPDCGTVISSKTANPVPHLLHDIPETLQSCIASM